MNYNTLLEIIHIIVKWFDEHFSREARKKKKAKADIKDALETNDEAKLTDALDDMERTKK